jgi:hypothetical protein
VDLAGAPIEMPASEFVRQAPAAVLQELGGEILKLSRLDESRIKK